MRDAPNHPRRRSLAAAFVLSTAMVLCSCSHTESKQTNPLAPTPAPTQAPAATYVVSGTVHDAARQPIEGAQVLVIAWPGASYGGYIAPGFSVKTDAAGRFQGRVPSGTYGVEATKPGFHKFGQGITVTADTVLNVALTPGVMITGRVFEFGVGPLGNAVVEVTSGPSRGQKVLSRTGDGFYSFGYLLPGNLTLRASKAGYDSVEQTLHADADMGGIDFTLKWSYGTCLRSVTPLLFDHYTARGGTENAMVTVNPGRHWEMTTDSAWIEVVSTYRQTGSQRMTFRIQPYPSGATLSRSGALMIRCTPTEGQNIWINQDADCAVQLQSAPETPSAFPASGGSGRLLMQVGVPSCRWHYRSLTDWIRPVGITTWAGDLGSPGIAFTVDPNTTRAERVGRIAVSETVWEVRQLP